MKLLIVLLLLKYLSAEPTPIVLWHGMGDTCCMAYSLGYFKIYLEKEIPGVYVISLRVGNSTVEDLENSYFMYPNAQVDYVCEKLANDPKLKGGFNGIGFSQGSQFLRAVVQRCGHKLGPIKNLITLGGQHQGVYGLPHCFALQHESCDYVRKLLNYAAYYRFSFRERPPHFENVNHIKERSRNDRPRNDYSIDNFRLLLMPPCLILVFEVMNNWVQKSLVQATYWHDPLDEATYRKSSEFLADINNERKINQTYVENLNKLEHFVMVKFENDSIVQPRETEWFGFYAPGQAEKLVPLQQSLLYKKDRLGLKKMDKAGKLVFLSQPGDHLRFTEDWFTESIIKPYLL